VKNAAAKKKQRKDEPCAIAPPAQPTNRKRAVALKLSVIARQLWQRFDQSVERDGLTRAKWTLIATVCFAEQGCGEKTACPARASGGLVCLAESRLWRFRPIRKKVWLLLIPARLRKA